MTEHDPRSRQEDEGIPDLQDSSPERMWSVDPQEQPIPGERPAGVEEFGTTDEEQAQGESLDRRLSREEPEAEYAGSVRETAGRLVEPDEGVHLDTEPDAIAEDVGGDFGGYTAEEDAMRVYRPE
ncbi:DUF5709 domain-containing protein [Bailinhaonella thermotolerans]|uniref:DUF5709 domain-containing protein n=1 Tax=Bailinhaonella thermotolerans TaxID=1070861 RepID=A0A3A4ATV0_9ACTN|nr:DUF5709 domain-containing protein [Bailinhaonella thermotolerans]RJL31725.1 hypothetical protein D5H75_18665 [Bailinhaonella thermotolerans]